MKMTKTLAFTAGALAAAFLLFGIVILAGKSGSHVDSVDATKAQLYNVQAAIKQYYADSGRLPQQENVFQELFGENSDGRKYLESGPNGNAREGVLDAFRQPIGVEYNGLLVTLRSIGRNKVHGDEDDYVLTFVVGAP